MAEDRYDCALSALWAGGIRAVDVRGTVKRWAEAETDDHRLETAFNMLPLDLQQRLAKDLPAGDAEREGGLRNSSLSEAVREFHENLEETTPEKLIARRQRVADLAWTPAVDDRCEARFRAGVDGCRHRKHWFDGVIAEIVHDGASAKYKVKYDDGDVETSVQRRFVRPRAAAVGAGAAGAAASGSAD